MWNPDRSAGRTDTSSSGDRGAPAEPRATSGSDDVVPIREAVRPWALQVLVAAYGRDTYRLLTDLADLLEASIAYVDRPTVEAHLERPLSDGDWSAVAAQFTAMAFDAHVGNAGTLRTDWIEDRLSRAGVSGHTPPAPHPHPRGRIRPSDRCGHEGQPQLPGLRLHRRLRHRSPGRRPPSAALLPPAPAQPGAPRPPGQA